mmetsp:Transcript_21189/g.59185  ORF Transcript_21189/g.59185 Transcript_21189/m.59185 type:complete len:217 (+) Transcript_21189:1020-1670(+)
MHNSQYVVLDRAAQVNRSETAHVRQQCAPAHHLLLPVNGHPALVLKMSFAVQVLTSLGIRLVGAREQGNAPHDQVREDVAEHEESDVRQHMDHGGLGGPLLHHNIVEVVQDRLQCVEEQDGHENGDGTANDFPRVHAHVCVGVVDEVEDPHGERDASDKAHRYGHVGGACCRAALHPGLGPRSAAAALALRARQALGQEIALVAQELLLRPTGLPM